MTEPFAKADEFGCVWILSGTRCIEAPKTWLAPTYADNLNTAARKYAADALRDASDADDSDDGFILSNDVREWLRRRADAVEKGQA